MKKYIVPVVRIGYGTRNIEVEANSEEEANKIALDEAGDYEFSEHSSDYEIQDAPKIQTSASLKAFLEELRINIIASYKSALNRAIDAYVEDMQAQNPTHNGVAVETDGYVNLRRKYLHAQIEGADDGNLTEYIDCIQTDGKTVSVRSEGDSNDLDIEFVSNENLIAIITEMQFFIKNPSSIDIF